jgi:diguanylate cyclase (GGDEF)-like protein
MLLRAHKVPLWSIWVVPFVLQTCAAVGLVGYLSLQNGQQAVNDLAGQLMDKTSQQVSDHLHSQLALPLQLTEMNLQAIASGDLNIYDRQAAERYLWRQSKTFPNISFVGYTLKNGYTLGSGRWLSGLDVVLFENLPGTNSASDYLVNSRGNRTQRLLSYGYDPIAQPWYSKSVNAGKLIWAGVEAEAYTYQAFSPTAKALQTQSNLNLKQGSYVAITTAAPFYDKQGQLLGVIGTDLMLNHLSDFLRTVKHSRGGQTFILEHNPQGSLIASSTQHPILDQQGDQVNRYTIFNSPDPLLRTIAPHIGAQTHNLRQHKGKRFKVELNQQHYYVQLTHWHDSKHGLDLLVVVTVPESDFMTQINANTRQTVLLCLAALVIAILFGILTARWVTRPINALNRAAKAMAAGDFNQKVVDSPIQEMNVVRQSFNQMAVQLDESFSQMAYNNAHDGLTGLLNRDAFKCKLAECIESQGQAQGDPDLFAILFLDLDFFKLVNDSFGHLAGDQLLIQVSQRLQQCVRLQDTLARLGGDEFVILLEQNHHPQQILAVAEQIIVELKKPFLLDEKIAFISTSIGIVLATDRLNDVENLLRNADIALYQAKTKGKGIYEVFDDEMHVEVLERLQLETDLRQILDQNINQNMNQKIHDSLLSPSKNHPFPLTLHYQPMVDTHSLELVGVEALIRWQHPSRGMIPPSKFIPIAEETGMIVPLGYWVLRQACQQMRQWQQQFPQAQKLQISVNLSTRQFLQTDLVEQIARILQETQLKPTDLKLEITESLFMSDRALMQTKLKQLSQLGVQLGLDDFGTGYSSLSYLHYFHLDTLKIDRSFIHQITTDARSLAVVESISTLAHKLGMTVVAEGVETQSQLDYLRNIGVCEQVQGFLISKAVVPQAITTMISGQTRVNTQQIFCPI